MTGFNRHRNTFVTSCLEKRSTLVRYTTTAFLQRAALWLCAGVGFDISQRLLDHFVDLLTERYALLAWLK